MAIVGLGVLFPFLLTIAALVCIDSRGPIFYRGKRVGHLGKIFKIWKFRTMNPAAELQGTTTSLNDPRITRVGKFLRRYKLDEFPQLLNVFRGEMSIVGPRPEVEEHTIEYSSEEMIILTVRPGITDYSSIRFASLDEVLGSEYPHQVYIEKIRSEKNRLRLEYVRNQSFMEDLKIVFLTIVEILKKGRPDDRLT